MTRVSTNSGTLQSQVKHKHNFFSHHLLLFFFLSFTHDIIVTLRRLNLIVRVSVGMRTADETNQSRLNPWQLMGQCFSNKQVWTLT